MSRRSDFVLEMAGKPGYFGLRSDFVLEMGQKPGHVEWTDVFCPGNWAKTGIFFGCRCVLSQKRGGNRDVFGCLMCALFFGRLNIYFFDSGTKQAERAFRLSSRSLL